MKNFPRILPIHHQRKMLDVQRLNGNPRLRSYNLAEHGFFVLSIAIDLSKILSDPLTLDQVDVILRHDFAETVTSDLPYPVKNLNEKTQRAWSLIEDEALHSSKHSSFKFYSDVRIKEVLGDGTAWWAFKFADLLELSLFCHEEMMFGNASPQIRKVTEKCREILDKMLLQLNFVDRVLVREYIETSKFQTILTPEDPEHEAKR